MVDISTTGMNGLRESIRESIREGIGESLRELRKSFRESLRHNSFREEESEPCPVGACLIKYKSVRALPY